MLCTIDFPLGAQENSHCCLGRSETLAQQSSTVDVRSPHTHWLGPRASSGHRELSACTIEENGKLAVSLDVESTEASLYLGTSEIYECVGISLEPMVTKLLDLNHIKRTIIQRNSKLPEQ